MASIPTPTVTPSAHDWAKDTTQSISHVDDPTKTQTLGHPVDTSAKNPLVDHSFDTRPAPKVDRQYSDLDFPGGYPRGQDDPSDNLNVQKVLASAQQTVVSATEAAARMIPQAAEAAKQYIPESVGTYLHMAPTAPSNLIPTNTAQTLAKVPVVGPLIGTPDSGVVPDSGIKVSPGVHHEYTLPSTETPSGSSVGIGSLPGNLSEVSVAKLPDERNQENLPSQEVPSGSAVGVGSLPGTMSETGVAKLPEESRLESLPTREAAHEPLGRTGGVGPLPGPPNEANVALPPDERHHGRQNVPKVQELRNVPDIAHVAATSNTSTTATTGHSGAPLPGLKQPYPAQEQTHLPQLPTKQGSLGHDAKPISGAALPGLQQSHPAQEQSHHPQLPTKQGSLGHDAKPVSGTALPGLHQPHPAQEQPHHHQGPTKEGSLGHEAKPVSGATLPGLQQTGPSHNKPHPQEPALHEAPTKRSTIEEPSAGHSTTDQTSSAAHTSATGHTRSASTGSAGQKVGFMSKMKGEAKIISGKLSGNESKIEEGRHMMGKI